MTLRLLNSQKTNIKERSAITLSFLTTLNYMFTISLWFCSLVFSYSYTAKNQYQKFETNIPRKGIAWSQSQFLHSCVYKRFIYSHDRSAYICCRKYVDRSWEYINLSQTHECGNWDWGRSIPRKGIHKWDFHCSAAPFYNLFHLLFLPILSIFYLFCCPMILAGSW